MAKQKHTRTEKPWSTMDLFDLCRAIEQGETVQLTAAVLGRPVNEVPRKAEELSLMQREARDSTSEP
jgi:hypothetical protein